MSPLAKPVQVVLKDVGSHLMLTAGVQKTRLTVLNVHRDMMPTCAALSNSGLGYVP